MTADWADFGVKCVGLAGGGVGFWWGLRQWKESLRWRKAERLDKLVAEFETGQTLRLAAKILDWSALRVRLGDDDAVSFRSEHVRDALRVHWQIAGGASYPPPQDRIRDALDTLLAYFVRLERDVAGQLVDPEAALVYFGY